MKKILSILAIAVVAFSFASCKGKNEPEKKEAFKIEVSNIKATSADVKITPLDSTVYYVPELLLASDLEKMTVNDLVKALQEDAAKYPGTPFADFLEYNWVFQGTQELVMNAIPADTELAIAVYQVDTAFNLVGTEWVTTTFKTPKLEVLQTIEVKAAGEYLDMSAYGFGAFVEIPVGDKGAYLEFGFAEGLPEGAFTEADFDQEEGSWYVITEEEYYPIVTASMKGGMSGDKYVISGEALAGDGTKFVVESTCEEFDMESMFSAPAKKLARKDVRKKS